MNRPLLERSITNLRRWEIDEIMISITAGSKAIREYFGDGSRLGIKINYVIEEPSCDIGRILKAAGDLFKEPFFVFNEDILCNMDLNALIQTHRSKSAGLTVAVTQTYRPCKNDRIESDVNGYLIPDKNMNSEKCKSGMIGVGVYVVEPSVLNGIPEDMQIFHVRDLFPVLTGNGVKIAICQGCSYWRNMSTPEQYLQAHEDILAGDYQIAGVHFNDRSVFKDGKSIIDSTAVITGPVYIGDNVRIGGYATIGPNAVIGDDVCVHMGGRVVDSVLWNNVDIGICAKLNGAIATSDCRVKRKAVYTDTAFTNNDSVAWTKNESDPADKLEA